jgi:hypothetical protein
MKKIYYQSVTGELTLIDINDINFASEESKHIFIVRVKEDNPPYKAGEYLNAFAHNLVHIATKQYGFYINTEHVPYETLMNLCDKGQNYGKSAS